MKQRRFPHLPLFPLFLLFPFLPLLSQENYQFKDIKRMDATTVKSQDQTGTCWAFSTASMLESEALRLGKGEHNLSEMYVVRHIYRQKCENYVRRMGKANLSQGGLGHDLLNAVRAYGIVPESVYPGRKDPAQPLNHNAVEKALKDLCDGFIKNAGEGKLQADWLKAVDQALDAEFGEAPLKFSYNGAVFTPLSFRDHLGIDPDAYVSITSFGHHPYWEPFILEVPDNFSNGLFYNLPINEMMRTLNNALQMGISVSWDADVSNRGFSAKNALAIVPETDWEAKTEAQRSETFKDWEPEKQVSQEYRQDQFDRLFTQDDHLMHIIGLADEAHSGAYYLVKNSWGEISDMQGLFYASEAYIRLHTISLVLRRDAIPVDIRKKLNIPEPEMPGGPRKLESGELRSLDAPQNNQKQGAIQSKNLNNPSKSVRSSSGQKE